MAQGIIVVECYFGISAFRGSGDREGKDSRHQDSGSPETRNSILEKDRCCVESMCR